MREVARRLVSDPIGQALLWCIGLAYLVVFQVVVGDLTLDTVGRAFALAVVPDWTALALRQRAPFQYEAVALVEAPFAVWLVSPMNLAIGLVLGLLTGVQVALVRVARRCAAACGLSPASGLLAGLPGLLAGSACCAPLLFILLGVQVTASLATLMSLMIPAAFLLLTGGLYLTLRVAARHCASAAAG